MKTSETIGKIAVALLKAQKNIGGATKGSANPFFKSKYANLGAVMEACKDALNDNDIVVLQPVGMDGDKTYVETVLLHSSGEYISDRMLVTIVPTPVKKDSSEMIVTPQAQGSAITYARRYGLQSMLFIPAEDDDANSAQGHQETRQQSGSRTNDEAVATDQQRASIRKLSDSLGKPMPEVKSFMQAARTIQQLAAECKAKAS